jgi:hypothetical protein
MTFVSCCISEVIPRRMHQKSKSKAELCKCEIRDSVECNYVSSTEAIDQVTVEIGYGYVFPSACKSGTKCV